MPGVPDQSASRVNVKLCFRCGVMCGGVMMIACQPAVAGFSDARELAK